MNSVDFRKAVIAHINNWAKLHPDIRVQFENSTVADLDRDTRPLLDVEIGYSDTQQADLNERPMVCDTGSIVLTVYVRETTGSLRAYTLREELSQLLSRQDMAGAKLHMARKLPNVVQIKGWLGYRLAIPFYHYYLS